MLEKFIEVMSPDVPMVYRAIGTNGRVATVSGNYVEGNEKDNLYFLGGVNEDAKKLTDLDVGTINYIRLDIDIKKLVKEHLNADINEEEIKSFIEEIKEKLSTNEYLAEWSYIVFSGGGCHIYYSNTKGVTIDDTITPKVWQLAMKRIYSLYDTTIAEEYLNADTAVCNTARIMRLPGSINQKYGVECEIIHSNPDRQSRLLSMVKALGLDSLAKQDKYADKRNKEVAEMKATLIASGSKDTDIKYEIINRIPAYLISQILLPSFVYDGKKNFKVQGKMKGFFYVDETNSICNGGSQEYAWGTNDSCWNNYSLVERQLSLSKEDTFKWYEEKFSL